MGRAVFGPPFCFVVEARPDIGHGSYERLENVRNMTEIVRRELAVHPGGKVMTQRRKARGAAPLVFCAMLILAGMAARAEDQSSSVSGQVAAMGAGVAAQTAPFSAGPAKTSGTDEDPMDACLKKADETARIFCANDLVAGAEQAVERAYQNALRVRRGREEEKRAHASDLTLITSDLTLLIESQATWQEEYDDKCSDAEVGQEDRLACQYDLLYARLKDLQQMN